MHFLLHIAPWVYLDLQLFLQIIFFVLINKTWGQNSLIVCWICLIYWALINKRISFLEVAMWPNQVMERVKNIILNLQRYQINVRLDVLKNCLIFLFCFKEFVSTRFFSCITSIFRVANFSTITGSYLEKMSHCLLSIILQIVRWNFKHPFEEIIFRLRR